jgi:hypothetical protein
MFNPPPTRPHYHFVFLSLPTQTQFVPSFLWLRKLKARVNCTKKLSSFVISDSYKNGSCEKCRFVFDANFLVSDMKTSTSKIHMKKAYFLAIERCKKEILRLFEWIAGFGYPEQFESFCSASEYQNHGNSSFLTSFKKYRLYLVPCEIRKRLINLSFDKKASLYKMKSGLKTDEFWKGQTPTGLHRSHG